MSEERIQLVDRRGRPAGEAPRRLCHGDPRLLHRWQRLPSHIYADTVEREYVFAFRTVYDGPRRPDPAEVAAGRFAELAEIRSRLRANPGEFTPHFREGFGRLQRHLRPGSVAPAPTD